ncbi:alpha-(1,3)-fucosyltransferase 10 [Salvelinus fontinalis]|uniref:alpha-(1,3)-fucosyltransferase 10 n=1 Tax=Salvelinus fontinalis TaxID=8038 RepID=UPI00248685D0|nr:alpha-(1,3)-fucosyltransferase 10 [Salvelinus fontinalis]
MARLSIVSLRKLFVFFLCLSAVLFLLITLQVVVELGQFERTVHILPPRDLHESGWRHRLHGSGLLAGERTSPGGPEGQYPYIVWWSPLTGEIGRLGECGTNKCFFTINRTLYSHPSTQAFLFYGTDFNIESLPLPRRAHHQWALFHEESPKNNYKLFHEPVITLFNHTATFSQHSQLPLTSQYLENLEVLTSLTYLVPLNQKNKLRKTLAPVVYVQSDCDPPSDRDAYVRELMKHIRVDSYGQCLHNKDLPSHLRDSIAMEEQAFYQILAQYKFILAFENAICDDYITEKLWRPLKLGVVPVYYGAPNVRQWLPSNSSAVVVVPDEPPEQLALYLKRLDEDDGEYATYLEWKLKREVSNLELVKELKERPWGVQDLTQENYIDVFECMVCSRVWENIDRQKKGLVPKTWKAEGNHLKCPLPRVFDFASGPRNRTSLRGRGIWTASYEQSKKEARALRHLAERNKNFTVEQYWREVFTD